MVLTPMREGTTAPPAASTDVLARSVPVEEATLFSVIIVLLRARRMIVAGALIAATMTALTLLLTTRTWVSTSSFMAESRRLPGNISGLAAQFGLSVPGGDLGQSPSFYADLATSRELIGRIVDGRYAFLSDSGAVDGTLVDIYRSKGRTAELRREAAIRELLTHIAANPNNRTSVVRVSVTTEHPELSLQINQRLLTLLDEFNKVRRRSQATAERTFTEVQAESARHAVVAVEDRLQRFLTRNRDYRNSPELTFQQERLAREVAMRQQIYTGLAQAAEQAKLDEVRDTPVLTIVESPFRPIRPQSQGLVFKTVAGFIVGAGLLFIFALVRSRLTRGRQEGAEEIAEFDALRRAALADLRSPRRWLGRG